MVFLKTSIQFLLTSENRTTRRSSPQTSACAAFRRNRHPRDSPGATLLPEAPRSSIPMTAGNALFFGHIPKQPLPFRPAFSGRFSLRLPPPAAAYIPRRSAGRPLGLFSRPTVVLYHLTICPVKSFMEHSPTFSLFSAKIWEKRHIYSPIFIIFNHFFKK